MYPSGWDTAGKKRPGLQCLLTKLFIQLTFIHWITPLPPPSNKFEARSSPLPAARSMHPAAVKHPLAYFLVAPKSCLLFYAMAQLQARRLMSLQLHPGQVLLLCPVFLPQWGFSKSQEPVQLDQFWARTEGQYKRPRGLSRPKRDLSSKFRHLHNCQVRVFLNHDFGFSLPKFDFRRITLKSSP